MIERNDRMLGESHRFLEVQERVSQIAPLNKPVLIVGERGTGKELVAARVHYLSERWGQPYIKVNCAAISESLMESELFGHEAGAFSGAMRQHKGYFERADGGTLFLDELATASVSVQEKLLRLIEYGELTRVGGTETINVDVRLVAATNGDLPQLALAEKFRSDLLDRLAFDVITLPPLRYRQEDILLLAEFFATEMVKELNRSYFPGFGEQAKHELINYAWPGNVRELKNVVERTIYRSAEEDQVIDEIVFNPFDSPYRSLLIENTSVEKKTHYENAEAESETANDKKQKDQFAADKTTFKEKIRHFEIKLIEDAYRLSQFNQRKAAASLGLSYHQFRGYLKKYNL